MNLQIKMDFRAGVMTRQGARIPVVDGPDELWVVLKLKTLSNPSLT
jgi:hypothetical protein